MQIPLFKTCRVCDKEKFITEFHKSKDNKFGRATMCKSCWYEKSKRWKQEHPERYQELIENWAEQNKDSIKEKARNYQQEHPEVGQRASAKWRASHPEQVKQSTKEQYEKHKDKRLAEGKEYRNNRKEHYSLLNRLWRRSHPEFDRNKSKRRRAAKHTTEIEFTQEQWLSILETYKHRCCYCGSTSKITQDHWIPLSRGGTDSASNIVPACRPCNSRKKDKTGDEYFALLGKPIHRL